MKSYSIISVQFGLYYFCCTYSKFSITRKFKMWYINHFELTNSPPLDFQSISPYTPGNFRSCPLFAFPQILAYPVKFPVDILSTEESRNFFGKAQYFLYFCSVRYCLFYFFLVCVCLCIGFLSRVSLRGESSSPEWLTALAVLSVGWVLRSLPRFRRLLDGSALLSSTPRNPMLLLLFLVVVVVVLNISFS